MIASGKILLAHSGFVKECLVMSAADCCTPCPTVVMVPGSAGTPGVDGAAGANGISAFTVLTAALTIPAINSNVTASVGVSSWAGVGQIVFLSDGTDIGHFQVVSVPNSTSIELKFLGYTGDASAAAIIGIGGTVSPSGVLFTIGALPNAITDNSTGTASDTIAAGVGVFTLAFPIQLAAMTTAAADLLTNYVLGFAFKILSVSFVTTTIGAGGGASQVLNLEIGSTNLTGGVVTVTLAGTDTLGELTAGTAVTAANTGTAASGLSVEIAAGGTVFTAGAGILLVQVQNMDTASAVASLATHTNALITAL